MSSTMVQGQLVTVGLRDKKKWEKYTTQTQREDPNWSVDFSRDMMSKYPQGEQPEPEAPKPEPVVEPTPEPTPEPEAPKEKGESARDIARRNALGKRIEVETEFLDKFEGKIDKDLMDKYRADVTKLQNELDNVGNDEFEKLLPHIPMQKNSHKKNVSGFVFGKTKVNVERKVIIGNQSTQMLRQRIETVWNSIPDSDRDLVKRLNIKESRKKKRGGTTRNGSWNPDTKSLNMNLKNNGIEKTFFHELGHAKWSDIKEKNPEAVKKFTETFKAIGRAPTKYAESYRNHAIKTERYYMEKQILIERRRPLTPNEREIIRVGNLRAKDLYENEAHAEMNAYVMGFLPSEKIIVNAEKMAKLTEAYKEMWDL